MGKPAVPEGGRPRVAEFFAGIGLVRMAVERAGCQVVFANDISEFKRDMYARNFGGEHFLLKDVREVGASDVPDAEIATASFPCTDTSLAGGRAGLAGEHSSLLWEFIRVLDEMGRRRPRVVMLENVSGFATSNDGEDFAAALDALENLGYSCVAHEIDAERFLPQSRKRIFIIGSLDTSPATAVSVKPMRVEALEDIVEHLPASHASWWPTEKVQAFTDSMSEGQRARLEERATANHKSWMTAYRRTREGVPRWEARFDNISGCLRTTRGGSSRQALVEAGDGNLRIRWMTGREYARLMGAANFDFGSATESQARFAMGDAVCVPVIEWLARHYLRPLATASTAVVRGSQVQKAIAA